MIGLSLLELAAFHLHPVESLEDWSKSCEDHTNWNEARKSLQKCGGHSHRLVTVCAFQVLHRVQVIISEGAFEEASIKISALWRNSLLCLHLHWAYSFNMNVYFVSEVCVLWKLKYFESTKCHLFSVYGIFLMKWGLNVTQWIKLVKYVRVSLRMSVQYTVSLVYFSGQNKLFIAVMAKCLSCNILFRRMKRIATFPFRLLNASWFLRINVGRFSASSVAEGWLSWITGAQPMRKRL